ncbi:hypothetical protein [Hyphomonas sp.]|uniref:hypothetical protein n=1 Tax=Hyphomonas sp. TaxID=87 RepID=UPI0025C58145|nr:hypothetical protein [Hyphomonas sp.]
MQLSKNVRQVIGAAIGAAIAAVVSTTLAMPAMERHEAKFGSGAATGPAEITP